MARYLATAFLATFALTSFVSADSTPRTLDLVMIPQAWADQYGAKSLDGTVPFMYVAKSPCNSSTFVLFIEGAWVSQASLPKRARA